MTDNTTNQSAASKTPSHVACQVRDRDGQKGFWTRIGSAWARGDGKGFNIQIETVPPDGRITLRVASEKTNNPLGRAAARPFAIFGYSTS